MIIYADTSAVLKLVVEEQESSTLAAYLSTASQTHSLVASMLLHTELHCAARRRAIHGELVNAALGGINLIDLVRSDLMYAAALPGRLRSAGAIHLATAIRLQVDVLVSYDVELLTAAVDAGINVLSPGMRTGP